MDEKQELDMLYCFLNMPMSKIDLPNPLAATSVATNILVVPLRNLLIMTSLCSCDLSPCIPTAGHLFLLRAMVKLSTNLFVFVNTRILPTPSPEISCII